MASDLIEAVRSGWGWMDIDPKVVKAINAFGNLLVEDHGGHYWRICPEETSAEMVAENEQTYNSLLLDAEFVEDWEMLRLVQVAVRKLGRPTDGRCLCLKVPAALGGKYDAENFGTIPITELILSSGDIARQIKNLPDGAQIQFKIAD